MCFFRMWYVDKWTPINRFWKVNGIVHYDCSRWWKSHKTFLEIWLKSWRTGIAVPFVTKYIHYIVWNCEGQSIFLSRVLISFSWNVQIYFRNFWTLNIEKSRVRTTSVVGLPSCRPWENLLKETASPHMHAIVCISLEPWQPLGDKQLKLKERNWSYRPQTL